MISRTLIAILLTIVVSLPVSSVAADEAVSRDEVAASARKAVAYFRTQAASHGGYLWRYSADLSRREGEGKASASTVWVQPPGTPSVGDAYLRAYERTGERVYLEAARETAAALVQGQLRSGGWDYRIEFDPTRRARYAYRVDEESAGARDTTTLDDNTTQAALRFLMRFDKVTRFGDQAVHETVGYALARLTEAQYPNGAWPQRFDQPPNPSEHPVKKASYPESWSRTFPGKNYKAFYTFNDNTIADMIATMLDAWEIYDDATYRTAAERGGAFILLAQMPDPQPAWAQQYDADMHPAWARKFEPPAVTGGESQGVMRSLLLLYRHTGNEKYLTPIPKAIDYLRRSALPDGRLARFYELRTNRPLYFTRADYALTYSDADMPTHYSFKSTSRLDAIEADFKQLRQDGPDKRNGPRTLDTPKLTESLTRRAKSVVETMDEKGRWIEDGRLRYHDKNDPTRHVLSTRTFIQNLDTLTEFLSATRP